MVKERKNIIIAGVPRAGKTTLSKRLAALGWSRISMDSIVSAFEQCFHETGINSYQGLSSLETYHVISRKLSPFIKAMLQSAYSEAGGECADAKRMAEACFAREITCIKTTYSRS